ncbi:MAG: hypothetical protein CMH50_05815 [Myxococcales bacterium]|nr:hypothetical protein [Myxococcales bacterium]
MNINYLLGLGALVIGMSVQAHHDAVSAPPTQEAALLQGDEEAPSAGSETASSDATSVSDGQAETAGEKAAKQEKADAPKTGAEEGGDSPAAAASTESAAEAKPKTDAEKKSEEPKEKPKPLPFIKGELTKAGSTVYIPKTSEWGGRIGLDTIDQDIYLKLIPEWHLVRPKWRIGLSMPLRALAYNAKGDERPDLFSSQAFNLRAEDYDEMNDYLAALLYAQYGRKEDKFFLNVSRVGAASLAHETLLRRYNPNLSTDTTFTSVSFDAYTKFGGFQSFFSNATAATNSVWGGLVFIKPVGAIMKSDPTKSPAGPRSLSIGIHWAMDPSAPISVKRGACDGSSGDETSGGASNQCLHLDSTAGYTPIVEANQTGSVTGIGIDAEYKIYKSEDAKTDLKVYLDASQLSFADASGSQVAGGLGITGGLLARLNFGEGADTWAARIRTDFRNIAPGFVPSYFDSLYAVQRYQFAAPGQVATSSDPTKFQAAVDEASAASSVNGYGVDLQLGKPRAWALQVAYENVLGGDPSRNQHLMVHMEHPVAFLDVFATYHLRGFSDWSQAFKLAGDNEILVSAVRWKLLPILWFNIHAQKSFSTEAYTDGVDPVRKDKVEAGYRNTFRWGMDTQLGFRFK